MKLRLSHITLGGVLAVGAACGGGGGTAPAGPPERIVLVVVDTLRRDHVSAYADRVATPNIDALARKGQVFTRALSAYHQTTMTMASLFTGHTPSLERRDDPRSLEVTGRTWCGLFRYAEGPDDACIPRSIETLAVALGRTGYWTAGVVTNKLLYRPGGYERGFARWEELPGFAPTATEANAAVRRVLAERPGDRFFLYVHYMDVHDYGFRGEAYARSVARVDRAVGDLMAALESEGLRKGTLVILTSDHGERLGERQFTRGRPGHNGNPSFDTLLQVPLIATPGLPAEPDVPLRSDDLYRLIRRVAGAGAGPPPTLAPGELYVSEQAFQTHRQGRWKLFRQRGSGVTRLIDLEADPGETRDVADAFPEVVAERAARIDALEAELGVADAPPLALSEEDADRLRALGYLKPARRAPSR